MKKKITIGVIVFFTLFLISFATYYFYSFKAVDVNNKEEVVFVVEAGKSKVEIAKKLEKNNLIRDYKMAVIYMFFDNDLSLQAGTYSLNKSMKMNEILNKFNKGDIRMEKVNITFIEGKRLTEYVSIISENFGFSEEEIIDTINDKEFLSEMVEKYWFLTSEILNDKIYYGLEGYILPDTYEFMSNSSIKDIFIRLLDMTDQKLTKYKSEFENSDYSVHEILTMASIVELEANAESDRKSVAQVIYKRLNVGMSLGMDVTTYYAEQKQMGDELTTNELNKGNAYNTRNTNMLGLPVGPISNPSDISINAVFNPSKTDYLYFYADVKTGLVYFANTSSEFYQIIREVG